MARGRRGGVDTFIGSPPHNGALADKVVMFPVVVRFQVGEDLVMRLASNQGSGTRTIDVKGLWYPSPLEE